MEDVALEEAADCQLLRVAFADARHGLAMCQAVGEVQQIEHAGCNCLIERTRSIRQGARA